jgi:hypothetical protein
MNAKLRVETSSGALASTVRLSSLTKPELRLDAGYYQKAFVIAKARVAGCGIPTIPLANLADAFVPNRIALVLSADQKAGAAYLRAHDAFDTIPISNRYLAAVRTRNYKSYKLTEGTILTP